MGRHVEETTACTSRSARARAAAPRSSSPTAADAAQRARASNSSGDLASARPSAITVSLGRSQTVPPPASGDAARPARHVGGRRSMSRWTSASRRCGAGGHRRSSCGSSRNSGSRGTSSSTVRPLLDWQYRDADGSGYSFVAGAARQRPAVLGILGYIATRRFDPALARAQRDLVDDLESPRRCRRGRARLPVAAASEHGVEPHVAIGAIGLTPSDAADLPGARLQRRRTAALRSPECGNRTVRAGLVRSLARQRPRPTPRSRRSTTRLLTRDDFVQRIAMWSATTARVPRKTPEYFRRRYARHPVYSYIVVAVAGRRCRRPACWRRGRRTRRSPGAANRGLRWVARRRARTTGPTVQSLLEEFDAEYADVYNAGIDGVIFARGGLSTVDPGRTRDRSRSFRAVRAAQTCGCGSRSRDRRQCYSKGTAIRTAQPSAVCDMKWPAAIHARGSAGVRPPVGRFQSDASGSGRGAADRCRRTDCPRRASAASGARRAFRIMRRPYPLRRFQRDSSIPRRRRRDHVGTAWAASLALTLDGTVVRRHHR